MKDTKLKFKSGFLRMEDLNIWNHSQIMLAHWVSYLVGQPNCNLRVDPI